MEQFLIYVVCALAATVLFITAVARLNDLSLHRTTLKRWWFRGFGMLCVAGGSVFVLVAPWYGKHQPDIGDILILIGMSASWITTPNQVPWWKYIVRGDEPCDQTPNRRRRNSDLPV